MNKDEALKRLIKFRAFSGWTYGQIAQALGVHIQTVTKWLQGQNKPSDMALKLIEVFLKDHAK